MSAHGLIDIHRVQAGSIGLGPFDHQARNLNHSLPAPSEPTRASDAPAAWIGAMPANCPREYPRRDDRRGAFLRWLALFHGFGSRGCGSLPAAKGIWAEFKRRNPRFGCPRIAQEIAHAFGIDINKDIVRRVLGKHYRPEAGTDGPSWLSFIGHVKDSRWSVDLFRCESILLRSHWVMVVMDVFTRRIIGFGVERAAPCGVSVCRMFNRIISGKSLPRHLSSDHDPLFRFHRWLANSRILEVEEIKSIPYAPVSHPFVERLIGTIRREFLDHVLIWNAVDLGRKLEEFRNYYNENRVHQSLSGSTPGERSGQPPPAHAVLDHYAWRYHCRGLFQMPIAA